MKVEGKLRMRERSLLELLLFEAESSWWYLK